MDPAVGQAGGSTAKALRRQLTEAKGRTRAEAPRPQPGKESAGQGGAGSAPAASSDGKHPFLDLAGKGMEVVAKAEEVAIAAMKTQGDLWGMVTEANGATAKRAAKSADAWNGM
ncbi:hypothetical protein QN362_07340 [Actimicrobium sp. CCC2.4]|uniref:hypothetical protein n=1 Tax=Actimicrobium sp. CCC2.4 TaxID=3048606 RepID=UPI002AC91137|nr:hypothetical protein [Actimicrobium sp. CCC2.4]MEB0135141.1 hypothetical protein [Actimicrobium sp. CCC2.4]WPX31815.1 hypothetical protein RHM62_16495 [Actimicrobium sp. CCC2.4]